MNSWYIKAKASATQSSFYSHVISGYRFLMRFYKPGDEIYMFGFSRGAYVAKFLAEMLDFVGLLCQGNEEMVALMCNAFSEWKSCQGHTTDNIKKKRTYSFMKGLRETFSRAIRPIRFLGLFDTINNIPGFPYSPESSAKIIRHAVSIDERRAKFRQDLIYQSERSRKDKASHGARKSLEDLDKYSGHRNTAEARPTNSKTPNTDRVKRRTLAVPGDATLYGAQSHSSHSHHTRATEVTHNAQLRIPITPDTHAHDADSLSDSDDESRQDIDEVWFSGGHGDVGGGWESTPGSKAASHIPLNWMVREAMKAGLKFDTDKVRELGCVGGLPNGSDEGDIEQTPILQDILRACEARIHDSLKLDCGLGWPTVLGRKIMEYIPLRRMDLGSNGAWKPIRWPLPRGRMRDIPEGVRAHGSVIRRLRLDPAYRPSNLIIGGEQGIRIAPKEYGMGEWVCVAGEGDVLGEIWMKSSDLT